jgi:septal ring factor EnvC (AmiA/AmiB activator)
VPDLTELPDQALPTDTDELRQQLVDLNKSLRADIAALWAEVATLKNRDSKVARSVMDLRSDVGRLRQALIRIENDIDELFGEADA